MVNNTGLVGPDGEEIITVTEEPLTATEAQLLRIYRKFLVGHGLREALYCERCWTGRREDGTRAYVTDNHVAIECRCRRLTYAGYTV